MFCWDAWSIPSLKFGEIQEEGEGEGEGTHIQVSDDVLEDCLIIKITFNMRRRVCTQDLTLKAKQSLEC